MLLTLGSGLVRISVCLFALRLVPTTKTSYRRWIWGLLTFCTIISIGDFLAQCFQCIPLLGLWDESVNARCFPPADMTKIAQVQGGAYFRAGSTASLWTHTNVGTAVITDFLCALLPILVFRNLQASLRSKLAIFVIMGLGFL